MTRSTHTDEWQRLAEVAHLYYVEDLTIEEIGHRLFLSRSTISRQLARAKERGVVEFRVHHAQNPATELGAALEARFHCRATVFPAEEHASNSLDHMAAAAAEFLGRHIRPQLTLGVTWGTTVDAVSRHLDPVHAPGVVIVQMNGAVTIRDFGHSYAGRIMERFARAYGAQVAPLPMPAFFDEASTRDAMFRERGVQRTLELRREADLVIASVGALESNHPSHLSRSEYLDADDWRSLARDGAVGNVGNVFLRADGSSDGIAVNERSTGLPFEDLRRIPTRLVVVADPAKATTVRAALQGGLITDLMVDETTARIVLGHPL